MGRANIHMRSFESRITGTILDVKVFISYLDAAGAITHAAQTPPEWHGSGEIVETLGPFGMRDHSPSMRYPDRRHEEVLAVKWP